MSKLFEELDYRPTSMGALSLRRRRDPSLNIDIHEIKLGDEFLMSSRFTAGEIALARLGLAGLPGPDLDVVVGGLGLGYTAKAVLEQDNIRSLHVIEALPEVIEWHRRGLLPLGPGLTADKRCRLVPGDFFALAAAPEGGFDPDQPARRFDAILVDIDHSPRNFLNPRHAAFYHPDSLGRLAGRLQPGGVFGLWSNDPPDGDFCAMLSGIFDDAKAHVVTFESPFLEAPASNTVYVARIAPRSQL